MVADGAGGAFIAWRDTRDSGTNGDDIYLQHLSAGLTVAPGWPANGLGVAVGPAYQYRHQVVADGTGGAIVVWIDNRGGLSTFYDVYAQRVTAAGAIAPGWPVDGLPVCIAAGDQEHPALASDGAGGAFVVWEDGRDPTTTSDDVYATHILADGSIAPGWAPNGNPVSATPSPEGLVAVLEDGSGGAIISWIVGALVNAPTRSVRALRLTGAGAVASGWPAEGVILSSGSWGVGGQNEIVSDGAGGAIVAWLDERNVPFDISETEIFAQRVRSDGTLAPGWPVNGRALCQAPDTQRDMDLVADGTGGAVAVWSDYRSNVADVYGQRVTADGTIPPGWLADGNPLAVGPGHQFIPRAALDGPGSVTLAFEDLGAGGTYDLYSQRILLDGSFPPGWSLTPRPLCLGNNVDDYQPAVASDGTGGLIVVALHDMPASFTLYASWVPGGVVATVIALVSAVATSDRVVLTWHGAESAGLGARVERRSEAGDWAQVALIAADGVGTFRYEDRAVRPGERYGYRLAYRDEGAEIMTAEEWVTVPNPRFALAGAQPNPVVDDLVVGFSLPDAGPARIELFDLAGRQVLAREVGSLGTGTHRVNLGAGRRLPAGVYHLVLSQAGSHATTRAVVVR